MPTTKQPPPPPPAIAYPPPPPPPPVAAPAAAPTAAQPHKLSTPMLAAIGGGAIAIIGGIIALVTLLGGNDQDKPSSSTSAPVTNSSPAPQPSGQGELPDTAPSGAPSSAPTSAPEEPTGDTGGTASGSAIDLGNGAVLVPAAGWQDSGTASDGQADLVSPEGTVEFFTGTGTADSGDVLSVLTTDIQYQIDNGSFSDLQLGDAEQGETGGQVFDLAAGVPFTATVSSQQGTTELTGTFGELLNSQTGFSAFIIVTSLSDADLQAETDAVNGMVDSMIG